MGRKNKNQTFNLSAEAAKKVDGLEEAKKNTTDGDKVEKDFLDILNYERKQSNNLLGKYVGEEYKLSDEMRLKLLTLPKRFGEVEGSTAYVSTRVGEFVLNFKIEFDMNPSFCKSKLYLIEVENGWDEEDIKHLTLLDEDEQIYHPEYRKLMFERWNVYYDVSAFSKDEEMYSYLHMQNEEFLFSKELIEVLSQLYVVRMLALLDKMGEVGQKVRLEFKMKMEMQLNNDPSYSTNYTMQKRMLDKMLYKNNAMPEILNSEEGRKILTGYSGPLKNLRDKTGVPIMEAKKSGKEPEKKKDAPSSSPKVKKKSPVKSGKPSSSTSPKYIPSTSSIKSADSAREQREALNREDPNFESRLRTSQPTPTRVTPAPRVNVAPPREVPKAPEPPKPVVMPPFNNKEDVERNELKNFALGLAEDIYKNKLSSTAQNLEQEKNREQLQRVAQDLSMKKP